MPTIDIVITWVDGNDPLHRAKRQAYQTTQKENTREDIGGHERYDASGEIFICIGSILRFAPFVHKIFLVTDQQDPQLQPFISRNFPENNIPIEIIDHKELFKGYEEYLPSFNSLSIETMLYRIPGLSEHFVYFNDDFFLVAPISAETWFVENKAVCYGRRFNSNLARFIRWIKPPKQGHKTFGFKDAMLNAADVLHSKYFWFISHAPLPVCKSAYEKFYSTHQTVLVNNIRHRFRDPSQFNPQVLFYLLGEKENRCLFRPAKGKTLFLKPKANKKNYLSRKLKAADKNPELLFGCINSLGEAPQEERQMFLKWIERKLNITLNNIRA